MGTIGIFSLAGQRLDWLAERRAVIASNIANASTPGYRARDVQPFGAVLDAAERTVVSHTDARHLVHGSRPNQSSTELEAAPGVTSHSGNNVVLDRELLKAGEVARSQQLSLGVLRAFHRLTMMAAKG